MHRTQMFSLMNCCKVNTLVTATQVKTPNMANSQEPTACSLPVTAPFFPLKVTTVLTL